MRRDYETPFSVKLGRDAVFGGEEFVAFGGGGRLAGGKEGLGLGGGCAGAIRMIVVEV